MIEKEIFKNIRNRYIFCDPCEELAKYVEFFSTTAICPETTIIKNVSTCMFASWTPTFYFNLGAPYIIDLQHSRHCIGKGQNIMILRNGHVTRHKSAQDNVFAVKFHPGGLEAILGISQLELIDRVVDLNLFLPQELLNQIRHQLTFEERIKLVQDFLLSCHLRKKQNTDHYIYMVSDSIGEFTNNMHLNVTGVAEKMFISSKTISRYFSRVIGTTPKNYFSILRTRKALNALLADKEGFDPYDYGYYDMSHFHKCILNFTGRKFKDTSI